MITLIKTGNVVPEIARQYGDFEAWFSAGLGVASLQQVDVFSNQPLPDLESINSIVITGSAAMVSHREEWSEKTARWLQHAIRAGLPVLGVCYGHQLLAHALGGIVGPNPNGRQIGTVTATMLDTARDDPLLGSLPLQFKTQVSHMESVLELPPDAKRLATSPLDENFVIRFSENAWGVQFHPEFSAAVIAKYIAYRSEVIRQEGLNPEQLLANVKATEQANSLLQKFAEIF